MDKDRVEGKVKDVAGRVERQVGEWTGDKDAQVHGAAKQAEGTDNHQGAHPPLIAARGASRSMGPARGWSETIRTAPA